jgi:hypothetical protein
MKQVKTNRVFYQEGYAQAELDLKREPLSDEEILVGFPQGVHITTLAFYEGVKFAEKMHDIGGGE